MELLYKLESLRPASVEYGQTIELVMASLHPHNDDKKIKDLPLLEAEIGADSSKQAAVRSKKTNSSCRRGTFPPVVVCRRVHYLSPQVFAWSTLPVLHLCRPSLIPRCP